jgi:hypothetical protein
MDQAIARLTSDWRTNVDRKARSPRDTRNMTEGCVPCMSVALMSAFHPFGTTGTTRLSRSCNFGSGEHWRNYWHGLRVLFVVRSQSSKEPDSAKERIVAVGLLTLPDLDRLGPTFTRAWLVDETPCFSQLLQAIDEADRETWRERDKNSD